MSSQQSTAIIIPARLASKRLPNKPLLEINSKTMIEHVWENAINSQLGTVIVATDSQEIIDVIHVQANGSKSCGAYCGPSPPPLSLSIFQSLDDQLSVA